MHKDDELNRNKLIKYRVVYDNLIDIVTEGYNPLDAKIRALNKLNLDWETAPLDKMKTVPLTEQ